jgi:hypothetical protein
MDNLIFFLHIIAWPVAVFCSILGLVALNASLKYPGSIQETLDKLKGIKRTFQPIKFFIIALICWAFIIAF